ncbi:MAG TPA: hypothetical protein VIL35_06415 [Vicinamibacterales bacterium]
MVDVITLAFAGDPMVRWSFRDPSTYLRCMPTVVKAFGGRAFHGDSAYCVDGYLGAALWLGPGWSPMRRRSSAWPSQTPGRKSFRS